MQALLFTNSQTYYINFIITLYYKGKLGLISDIY